MVVDRGANVDISGPWGTPLQMTWKIVRHCKFERFYRRKILQETMKFLKDQGANCDWVEPDGSTVNKADIDALCSMTERQLEAQCEPRFKYPDWYTWEALTTEEKLVAEAKRDRRLSELKEEELWDGLLSAQSFPKIEHENESTSGAADQDGYQSEYESGSLSDSPPSPSSEYL